MHRTAYIVTLLILIVMVPALLIAGEVPSRTRSTGTAVPPTASTNDALADPSNIYWGIDFETQGLDGDVHALCLFQGKLIAGGEFLAAGSNPVSYIAAWDGSSWLPLGSGMNGSVLALLVHDGKLIAAGGFTDAGGVPVERIAAWDGSAWSPLGDGLNDLVYSLTIHDGNLIAGGDFTGSGSVLANYIASWDGSVWSPLGSGMNNVVRALADYNGAIMAGGIFTEAGGVPVGYIASWDGDSWADLGSGCDNWVKAFTLFEGKLIVGGHFASAGGAPCNHIAAWDGANWSPLGDGTDESVRGLSVHDGKIIVGGDFITAGGAPAGYIAAWNRFSWMSLGSGLNQVAQAFASDGDNLYVGGRFVIAGDKTSSKIARWSKPAQIVSGLGDSGPGSLREAITTANSTPGWDDIRFTVSGTIHLLSPFPAIASANWVAIYGSSDPTKSAAVTLDGSNLSTGNGLLIMGSDNIIDGLAITGFPGSGVAVIGATSIRNRILNCEIYDNGGLAIDLGGDGVTANDLDDLDIGPNNLVNSPLLDSAVMNPDSTFTVYGQTSPNSRVQLFVAHPGLDQTRPADPSGHGEAYSQLADLNADGTGAFSYTTSRATTFFTAVTALATDNAGQGQTSEFSENISLIPAPMIIVAYGPVNIIVTNPDGLQFGLAADDTPITEIPSADYFELPHDSLIIHNPIEGQYLISFVTEDETPPEGGTFSSIIRIDGTAQINIASEQETPATGSTSNYGFNLTEGYHYLNGDANHDLRLDVADAVFLINFVFKFGSAPQPILSADADCNLTVNVGDVVSLINYVFLIGPPPCYFEP